MNDATRNCSMLTRRTRCGADATLGCRSCELSVRRLEEAIASGEWERRVLYTNRGGGVSATPDDARLPASARPLAARVETGNFADDCQRLAEQIERLCLICRYWVATNGPYCEACAQ